MNFSYRFQRDILRQIDVSGQWPVRARLVMASGV